MATGLSIELAGAADAAEIAALRTAARRALNQRFGLHSRDVGEESVLRAIGRSQVLVGRVQGLILATVRLDPRKPWAANLSDFTPVPAAIYLHDVAVDPARQGKGYGRALEHEAIAFSRKHAYRAARVDAYDAPWGAGPFYEKCGFAEVSRLTYRGVPLIWFEQRIVV